MDADHEHRVIEFLSLFDATPPNLEAMKARLSPDVRYQNPVRHTEPLQGPEPIIKELTGQVARYKQARFRIDAMASNARQVFTERTDTVTLRDGRTITAFICAVFDIDKAGLISGWREYWDMADAVAQLKPA
jgi:limonene-1,2-epoxide hydrolase